LHTNLKASSDLEEVLAGARLVFLAMPSRYSLPIVTQMKPYLSSCKELISTSKGMHVETGQTIYDELVKHLSGEVEMLQLAGPMVANEFSRGSKTQGILTRPHHISRREIAELLQGSPLSLTFTTDVQGTVWAAILKNIYALGFGILDVISPDNINLKGIYITKAFEELVLVSKREGGFVDTAYGLAGLGDFMATAMSPNSHNRIYGMHLASRHAGEEDSSDDDRPEGYFSLKAMHVRYGEDIDTYPIMAVLHHIVVEQGNVTELLDTLSGLIA
jgi:glycerol-3-phosphate dehydrogenase (NAD(P)+)